MVVWMEDAMSNSDPTTDHHAVHFSDQMDEDAVAFQQGTLTPTVMWKWPVKLHMYIWNRDKLQAQAIWCL